MRTEHIYKQGTRYRLHVMHEKGYADVDVSPSDKGESADCKVAVVSLAEKIASKAWLFAGCFVVLAMATSFLWEISDSDQTIGYHLFVSPKFVTDGTTFYGTTAEGKLVRVRLRSVEVPTLRQPYGREARDHLKSILLLSVGQSTGVSCFVASVDDVGGVIAEVFFNNVRAFASCGKEIDSCAASSLPSYLTPLSGGFTADSIVNVGDEMVRSGWAWVIDKGWTRNTKLQAAMDEAKVAKRGLWGGNVSKFPYRRSPHSREIGKKLTEQRQPISRRRLFASR